MLLTDLPRGQHGMAEELTEKLIEKVREYVFLYDPGDPQYKNIVKKAEAWRDITEELDQTSSGRVETASVVEMQIAQLFW